MRAALRGSYVDFVVFMGISEIYPLWFQQEIYERVLVDEHHYSFWVPVDERAPDYYEKNLIEEHSVIIKKPDGDTLVTDIDTFNSMYTVFQSDITTNSGIAAYDEDCIEYVICQGGELPKGYPDWFYEYFTEAINFPINKESVFFLNDQQEVSITGLSVFLRNRFGEIRAMSYENFLEYYDPSPSKEDKYWFDMYEPF